MINCYVFFDDAMELGKMIEVIQRVKHDIKIYKILDAKQFTAEKKTIEKHLLITNYRNHQILEINGSNELDFQRIVIVDDVENEEDENISYVNKKNIITSIYSILDDFITKYFKDSNYVPVVLKRVIPEFSYGFDIFARSKENTYLNILKSGQTFKKELLERYKEKGLDFMYVKKKDYKEFCLQTKNNTTEDKNAQLDSEETSIEINAVESLHNYIEDLGIDKSVIDLTKSLHKEIESKFNDKVMGKLLDRFKKMEGTFLYNHSYLTSTIAITAGNKFTWMNYENKEKLYLGSVLHDLGYKYKENALHEGLNKNEVDAMDFEEKEDILEHTVRFEKHLAKLDSIHPDVLRIVRDHHGVHDEYSYPKQVYANDVNLVFGLFILSHEFSLGLYSISFKEEKIPYLLEQICERFDKGNYKKLVPSFKEAMLETFVIK
jgi:HD-GYP domain-containing protein (c-di-GMP phosphodiesterase class II)